MTGKKSSKKKIICPRCEQELTYLRTQRRVMEICSVTAGTGVCEGRLLYNVINTCAAQEPIEPAYYCPKCGKEIATVSDYAIKFLKGEWNGK